MMNRKTHVLSKALFMTLVICMAASLFVGADTLYLKSGRKIEGTIQSETATAVIIKTTLAGSMTIPKDRIDRIERAEVTQPAAVEDPSVPAAVQPVPAQDFALEPFLPPDSFAWIKIKENPASQQTAFSQAWNDPSIRAWRKRAFKDIDKVLVENVGFTVDEALELPITNIALGVATPKDWDKGPGFVALVKGDLKTIWKKISPSTQKRILEDVKLPLSDLLTTVSGNGALGLYHGDDVKKPVLFLAFPSPSSENARKAFKKKLQPKTFAQATDYDEQADGNSFKLTEIYIPNGPQYYYAFLKSCVVVTEKRDTIFPLAKRLLANPGPPTSAHSAQVEDSEFSMVFNAARFVPSLIAQLKKEGELPPEFDKISDIFGLTRYIDLMVGVKSIGKGVESNSSIHWTGQTPIPIKWLGQPGEFNSLQMIDPEAKTLGAVRLAKPLDIYNDIMKLIEEIGGEEVSMQAKAGLELMKTQTGIDLADDLLAHLKGEYGVISEVNPLNPMMPNLQVFIETSDKTALQTTINKLIQDEKIKNTLETKSYNGVTYHSFSPLPIIQLAFGFVDNYFVFVYGDDTLNKPIDTFASGSNFASSPKLTEAKKHVDWPAVSFGLSDVSSTFDAISNISKFNPEIPTIDLPDAKVLSKYAFPTVRTMTVTDNSLKMKDYSSGLEIIAVMGFMSGMFSGIAVPNFLEAQERAKAAKEGRKPDAKRQSSAKTTEEMIGQSAPAFKLDLLDGGTFDLAAQKGKNIIILDFWATWCPPCRKALPAYERLAKMYQDKGVMLVAVDLKEDPEKVKQFLNDQGLDLIVAMDKTGKVGRLYKASSIPTTVIVDKDGTIQAVHIGYMPGAEMTMKKELDQLLAGKKLADD